MMPRILEWDQNYGLQKNVRDQIYGLRGDRKTDGIRPTGSGAAYRLSGLELQVQGRQTYGRD